MLLSDLIYPSISAADSLMLGDKMTYDLLNMNKISSNGITKKISSEEHKAGNQGNQLWM